MEAYIGKILKKHFAEKYNEYYEASDLLKYLNSKSSAIHGNTKSRKSLGNIYAIYSILHFYLEDNFYNNSDNYKTFEGYEFTTLLNYCSLPSVVLHNHKC